MSLLPPRPPSRRSLINLLRTASAVNLRVLLILLCAPFVFLVLVVLLVLLLVLLVVLFALVVTLVSLFLVLALLLVVVTILAALLIGAFDRHPRRKPSLTGSSTDSWRKKAYNKSSQTRGKLRRYVGAATALTLASTSGLVPGLTETSLIQQLVGVSRPSRVTEADFYSAGPAIPPT